MEIVNTNHYVISESMIATETVKERVNRYEFQYGTLMNEEEQEPEI